MDWWAHRSPRRGRELDRCRSTSADSRARGEKYGHVRGRHPSTSALPSPAVSPAYGGTRAKEKRGVVLRAKLKKNAYNRLDFRLGEIIFLIDQVIIEVSVHRVDRWYDWSRWFGWGRLRFGRSRRLSLSVGHGIRFGRMRSGARRLPRGVFINVRRFAARCCFASIRMGRPDARAVSGCVISFLSRLGMCISAITVYQRRIWLVVHEKGNDQRQSQIENEIRNQNALFMQCLSRASQNGHWSNSHYSHNSVRLRRPASNDRCQSRSIVREQLMQSMKSGQTNDEWRWMIDLSSEKVLHRDHRLARLFDFWLFQLPNYELGEKQHLECVAWVTPWKSKRSKKLFLSQHGDLLKWFSRIFYCLATEENRFIRMNKRKNRQRAAVPSPSWRCS